MTAEQLFGPACEEEPAEERRRARPNLRRRAGRRRRRNRRPRRRRPRNRNRNRSASGRREPADGVHQPAHAGRSPGSRKDSLFSSGRSVRIEKGTSQARPGGRIGGRRITTGEFRLQNEKVRIYHLAHELDMESKALLDLCRQHGIDVKNQLSTLSPSSATPSWPWCAQGCGCGRAAKAGRSACLAAQERTEPDFRPSPVVTSRPVARQPEAVTPTTAQRRPTLLLRRHRFLVASTAPADRCRPPTPRNRRRPSHLRAARRRRPFVRRNRIAGAGQGPGSRRRQRHRPRRRDPPPPNRLRRDRRNRRPSRRRSPPRRFGRPLFRRRPLRRPMRNLGRQRPRSAEPGGADPSSATAAAFPARAVPLPRRAATASPCRRRRGRPGRRRSQGTAAGRRPAQDRAKFPPSCSNREGHGPSTSRRSTRHQPAAAAGRPASSGAPVVPEEIIDDEEGGDKKKGGAKRGPGGVVGRDARHNQRNIRQAERKSKAENRHQRSGRVGLLTTTTSPRIRVKKQKKQASTARPSRARARCRSRCRSPCARSPRPSASVPASCCSS